MKTKRRMARVLIAIVSVSVFAALLPALPAGAIYNGDAIKTAPPWAAFVTVVGKWAAFQSEKSICSGTIVSDGWVLTAAHCIYDENSKTHVLTDQIPNSALRIVLGRSDLRLGFVQGGQWTVDDVFLPSDFKKAPLTDDLALLHLHGALPAAALPLPLAPRGYVVANGQSVDAFGYGNVSEQYANGDPYSYVRQHTNYLRSTKDGSYKFDASCSITGVWCFRRIGASEILHGDSGGPWVTDKSNPFVIGVTSAALGFDASSGTFAGESATKVTTPSAHDWIVSTAGVLVGVVGRIYRDPATGQSWMFERDGFRHSVPDGGTYNCLRGQGHRVVNPPRFVIEELPRSTVNATCRATPGVNGMAIQWIVPPHYLPGVVDPKFGDPIVDSRLRVIAPNGIGTPPKDLLMVRAGPKIAAVALSGSQVSGTPTNGVYTGRLVDTGYHASPPGVYKVDQVCLVRYGGIPDPSVECRSARSSEVVQYTVPAP